jgi:hypothetical protein
MLLSILYSCPVESLTCQRKGESPTTKDSHDKRVANPVQFFLTTTCGYFLFTAFYKSVRSVREEFEINEMQVNE